MQLVRDMTLWCFLVGLLVLGASATWLPTQEAVDAAAGRDMRCLHREGKSNAFFYFDDADEEAAAYATPTETEADAVDVTGKVTGNVDLLEAVAAAGGWTVSFHANLTTFDCVVTSTGITLDGILEVGNFVEVPTLKTGFSALALVPEPDGDASYRKSLTSWKQPFSNNVWGLLAGVMLCSGFIYGFVIHEEGEPNAAGALQGVYQSMSNMTGAGGFEPRTSKGKVFALFFSFFTLLVVSAYTANLTTFLTVEFIAAQPIERISSFSELGLSPCYYGESTEWFLEQEHPNIRGVSLRDLDGYDPSLERYAQLFRALREGQCSGIVTWTHYARNVIINDQLQGGEPTGCDIEPVGPEEGTVYYSIPMRRDDDDPLRAAASYVLGALTADNTILALTDRYFPSDPLLAAGCGAQDDDANDQQYTLRDMVGYFVIAAVAVGAGLLGYCVEALARLVAARRHAPEAGGKHRRESHVAFASPEHVEVLARLEDLRHDVEAVTAKIDDAGRKARSAHGSAASPSPSHARRAHSPRKESKEAPAPAPPPPDDGGWLSPTALACGDIMGEDV
ncbi:ionotropic glutamate receptor [Aureococcus anophagefferens]|nr:ionotropic glutamate receptor [Aureococcus anophagefferens]